MAAWVWRDGWIEYYLLQCIIVVYRTQELSSSHLAFEVRQISGSYSNYSKNVVANRDAVTLQDSSYYALTASYNSILNAQ